MKIFFLCRTGHHTSLIAAAIYMGLIKGKRNLQETISRIRGYDKINFNEIGTPFFVGTDDKNNEIFTIGIARESILMERAVKELIAVIGVEPQDRKVINVSKAVSVWTRIGLIIKKIRLNNLARVFFYLGASQEYYQIKRILRNNGLHPG